MENLQSRTNRWLEVAEESARRPAPSPGRVAFIVYCGMAVTMVPVGAFVVVLGLPAGVASVVSVVGSALVIVGLVTGGLAVRQRRELRRGRELREAFRVVVARHGGKFVDGPQLAHWLIQHWDGEYPVVALSNLDAIYRVLLEVDGAPVLIDLMPFRFHAGGGSGWSRWWARVVVAAARPLHGARLNPDHPVVQRLQSRGFQPECEPAGLVARGSSHLEKVFRRRPATIFEAFEVAADLAELTRAVERERSGTAEATEVTATLT